MTHAVDQHALGVVDATDYLVGDDPRLVAITLFDAEGVEDRLPGLPDISLAVGMHLEHAVMTLDDLHSRRDIRRLEGDIREVVDRHSGGDLHEETRLTHLGKVALRDRRLKGRELRLQGVDNNVGS